MSRFLLSILIILAILTSSIFLSCQKEAETPPDSATVLTGNSVKSSDGVRIAYEVHGQGEPALVFVHCWCCDRHYWDAQVDTFAEHYTVVTIDLAGHGESGLNRKKWTIASLGNDVKTVVKKLKLEHVILIGHSMGGPVILEAARRMPNEVISLIGVDTFLNFEIEFGQEQIDAFLKRFREDFKGATRSFTKTMFPEDADSSLVERIVHDMASAPPEVGIPLLEDLFKYDYVKTLKKVRIPIRCINSLQYPTDVEANRRHALSFEAVYIGGVGHFVHMEDPKTFNRLLFSAVDNLVEVETSK
jgi:pimeloyl-ACP methyl ester carboxylesterase